MKVAFIADANSVHTRRWIQPLAERDLQARLFSYTRVTAPWPGVEVDDLTEVIDRDIVKWPLWAGWIRRRLDSDPPRILHCHQVHAAGWLGAFSGFSPLLVSAWGSDLLRGPRHSWTRRQLARRVLRRCDHLIAPSETVRKAALALGLGEDRASVIPWGIDLTAFVRGPEDRESTRTSLGISTAASVVLCPRAIAPLYNIEVVIAALGRLVAKRPDVLLVLIEHGVDQRYGTEMRAAAAKGGLQEHVRWLAARREPREMARLYRMADMAVSIPDSEGYGASVFESLACGCPIVISDVPVFRDKLIDGRHVLKVPARDAQATAEALDRLLADRSVRQSLASAGLEVAAQETDRHRVDRSLELYHHFANVGH
jgi:glycosyltransferase involved in cell wall biosynthesis